MNHNYNKHNNNKRVAIDSIFLPPILFLSMVVLCLQKWIKNPIIRWNRNWEKFHFRLIWKIFFHSFIQTGRKTNGSLVWSRFFFHFIFFVPRIIWTMLLLLRKILFHRMGIKKPENFWTFTIQQHMATAKCTVCVCVSFLPILGIKLFLLYSHDKTNIVEPKILIFYRHLTCFIWITRQIFLSHVFIEFSQSN